MVWNQAWSEGGVVRIVGKGPGEIGPDLRRGIVGFEVGLGIAFQFVRHLPDDHPVGRGINQVGGFVRIVFDIEEDRNVGGAGFSGIKEMARSVRKSMVKDFSSAEPAA